MPEYSSQQQSPKNYQPQEAQLIMGLKHHFSKTLSEVPLDVAIQAVSKVWQSCQIEQDKKDMERGKREDDVIHL
ncbi:hypothetical protein [Acaryochloris thomasi]|uniref:hypothetical protein n=1 Tax=Acaryochloris thomasi TaxID=2929456 RepID=UPI000DA6CAC6|nr:hypothetical protein [Acaryochloris thomasi]